MLERFARPRVIIAHDLPQGIDGLTDGKRIWIRAGLPPHQARSVLAHELVHVERGIDFPAHLEHVEEATVEEEAARRSIPLRALADALAAHGRPCHAAARDLFVDLAALQARIDGLTPFERLALRGLKLRAKGNTMRKTLTTAAAGFATAALLVGCSTEAADTAEAEGAGDLMAQTEQLQADLDPWFEGCEWENAETNGAVQGSCAEHEIGTIVAPGESSARGILDGVAEGTPVGGFVAEDNWAAWSTSDGTVNQMWDALGASGERGSFSEA